jgi:Flp pilus assembly protein TadD
VYITPGRFWLAFAGISLMFFVGCQQSPPQKGTLGNLPNQFPSGEEPRVNATTYFAHGHLLERQGQFERAAVQYQRALALQPEFLSARNRLGITLNKLGRNAEATWQFQRALVEHPGTAYLHNNLGFSLYLQGKYEQAEAALTSALELKPDFARAHMNLALVLARLGRFEEAFNELTQTGSEADACYNMGILLAEAEKYAEAAQYLEGALAARPDFDAARQQLREVSRLAAERDAREEELAAETDECDEEWAAETDEYEEEWAAETDECEEEWAGETEAGDASLEPAEELVAGAPILEGPPAPAKPEAFEFAQEPGIDAQLLFAMIDEAIAALRNRHGDLFDELWCQLGYYLFSDTAPAEPQPKFEWLADQPEADWLVDQPELREAFGQRPVGK